MWSALRRRHLLLPLGVLGLGLVAAWAAWFVADSAEESARRAGAERSVARIAERVSARVQRVLVALEVAATLGPQVEQLHSLTAAVRDPVADVVSVYCRDPSSGVWSLAARQPPLGLTADVPPAGTWLPSDGQAVPAAGGLLALREDIEGSGVTLILGVPAAGPSAGEGDRLLITASVPACQLVRSALASPPIDEGVCVAVRDTAGSETLLVCRLGPLPAAGAAPHATVVEIAVAGRTWQVELAGEPAAGLASPRSATLLALSLVLLAVLCAYILATALRYAEVVSAAVEARTGELSERNALLERQERELAQMNLKLLEQTHTDPLTGITNRRGFEEQLFTESQRSRRTAVPFGLLFFDVDNFKGFNDRYGHVAGDEVLQRVAATLLSEARRIDGVARYGGEEFVILASGIDEQGLRALAERIRQRVVEAAIENAASPHGVLTVSGGGALSSPDNEHDSRPVLERADACLYQAKEAGRNRIVMDSEGTSEE